MLPIVRATSTAGGGAQQQSAATATLKITIPRGNASSDTRRRRQYVSPATNSLTIAQNNGAPSTIGLTRSSPQCASSAGSLTCTLQFPATPGIAQSFTVRTFASLDGSGTPLSLQTVLATIVAGQANQLNFVLDGVVSSLSVALTKWILTPGQSGSSNVVLNALDASGNTIVGPGTFADASGNAIVVSLGDSDTSGATQLGSTSATQAATIPLAYNGATGVGTVTITATAPNLTSQSIVLSLTDPAAKMTVEQVTTALTNVNEVYATMQHSDIVTDLNTLATEMVASRAFQYAAQTPGGISAVLSDGTPVLIFADHPEGLASPAAQARIARPLIATPSPAPSASASASAMPSATPVPTPSPSPLAPGPGPASGHEMAFLINTTDPNGAFVPSRQRAFGQAFVTSGFTNANGYNVDVLAITIDNIVALGQSHPLDFLNIATHGMVFSYVPTPGVTLPPNLPTANYGNLSDSTYNPSLLATYQSDFDAGNLLVGMRLSFSGNKRTQVNIVFTPAFVAEHVTFNPGALVINSSCFGQSPAVAGSVDSTFQNAGAGQYLGWTKAVAGVEADETDAFFYDRLLGEQSPPVTGLQAYAGQRTPAQRPFDVDDIEAIEKTEIRSSPLTVVAEPYANSDVHGASNNAAPPAADGTLARLVVSPFGGETIANSPIIYALPSISTMSVSETRANGTLTINGTFPENPGTVTVTDNAGKSTLTPATWSQTGITVTLPASGPQSAGLVQVFSADGIGSNAAPLTQWSGSLTYKKKDSLINLGGADGSGAGNITVNYNLTFRSDVHPTVPTVDASPVPQNFTFENVEGNSTATIANYAGTFVSSDGKIISDYAIPLNLADLTPTFPPLGPGTFEVRAFVEGSQPSPCNNGEPGNEGDAGNILCPITGWYIQDNAVTCTDSGQDTGCPDISLYDQLGSYGGGFDAGGLLSMTMNPATYAVNVSGTPVQFDTIHFGGASSTSLDPASATMTGTIGAPSYAPAATGPSAVHARPSRLPSHPQLRALTRTQTLHMLRAH